MYLEQTEEDLRTKRLGRRLATAFALAAAIVIAGGVSAIVVNQTIPGVGPEAAAFIINQTIPDVGTAPIISSCVTPKSLTANPATVAAGSSGHIRFECGTEEAFHVDEGATAFATFNLTAGYTALWIFLHSTDTPMSCSAGGLAQQLTSGENITFASAGDYDYCAEYTAAPATGLEAFTISWTSP